MQRNSGGEGIRNDFLFFVFHLLREREGGGGEKGKIFFFFFLKVASKKNNYFSKCFDKKNPLEVVAYICEQHPDMGGENTMNIRYVHKKHKRTVYKMKKKT